MSFETVLLADEELVGRVEVSQVIPGVRTRCLAKPRCKDCWEKVLSWSDASAQGGGGKVGRSAQDMGALSGSWLLSSLLTFQSERII